MQNTSGRLLLSLKMLLFCYWLSVTGDIGDIEFFNIPNKEYKVIYLDGPSNRKTKDDSEGVQVSLLQINFQKKCKSLLF